MSNDPHGAGGRWWEIRGAGQPDEDEGGYRELMTDSRGRSRPERSLSVGADLADEPRHPSRAFLWPIVSAVAAVGLILSVIVVVSTGKHQRPENAMAAPPAPRSSAPGNAEAQQDATATPDRESAPAQSPAQPPTQPEPPPATGDDTRRPPARPPADAPRSPAAPLAGPPSNPEPVTPPSGNPDGAGGGTGTQPIETPSLSAPAPPQDPQVTFDSPDGSAPPTPKSTRVTLLKADRGGGCTKSTGNYYACTLTSDAPVYLAKTKESRYTESAGHDRWFLCQSDGSKYSVGNRANHWWAQLAAFLGGQALWVPVVFLKSAPSDDKPVTGLPLCDGVTAPATESTGSASAPKAPTSTAPTSPAPTSTGTARAKSTGSGRG
ncbi:MAG: hypothetical protein JO272_13990 [Pseudonocardiales bacterium]|nr:hypothetical protein [Pseudonocardiales bacterium]